MTCKTISRILFYGLFLVGPYCLIESHSHYIKSKPTHSAAVASRERDEEKNRALVLDRIGISAFAVWSLWLIIVLGCKIRDAVRRNGDSHP